MYGGGQYIVKYSVMKQIFIAIFVLVVIISQLTGKTPVTFFIGGDKTDRDVFQLLKNGITIRVGRSQRSLAQYHLNDTKDVYKFLEWLSLSKAT